MCQSRLYTSKTSLQDAFQNSDESNSLSTGDVMFINREHFSNFLYPSTQYLLARIEPDY